MKTPLETARYTFAKMHSQAAKACENEILYMIESAIESDRAQRSTQGAAEDYRNGFDNTIAAGVYDCLMERETDEAARAAEWVAGNENGEFWDRFVGPMLDEIERCAA